MLASGLARMASRTPKTIFISMVSMISFLSSSSACFSLPAPRCCPIIMATVEPIAIADAWNKFAMVEEIFVAETTSRPRTE